MTASRSSRVMLFFISGQSRPAAAGRMVAGSHQNGPLKSSLCSSGRSSGSQPVAVAFDQVAGGGGDGAGVGIEAGLPATASSGRSIGAKPRRRTRRSRTPCRRSATRATISAAAPQLVQPLSTTSSRPVLLDRRGDRVDVERAQPDRVDDLGLDADVFQIVRGPQAFDLHVGDADERDVVARRR